MPLRESLEGAAHLSNFGIGLMRSDVLPETTHESGSGGRIMIRNDGTSYVRGQLPGSRVWAAKLPTPSYSEQEDVALPELSAVTPTSVMMAVRSIFEAAGLDRERFGREDWNPLAQLIRTGDRVVIKPNWVHHVNMSGRGLACLVTQTAVIDAVLQYVLKARPSHVVIGDAPIQGCDFEALRASLGIDTIVAGAAYAGIPITVEDFRQTILPVGRPGIRKLVGQRPLSDYVLVDLRDKSLLEPISGGQPEFRVTMYNPDELAKSHRRGRHEYLIARDVLEADVFINMPKLKTHKKAGITGALKNAVGINGLKDYLPHHRKGGSRGGGDCYRGRSLLKRVREALFDAANRAQAMPLQRALSRTADAGGWLERRVGADDNIDGSWYGNDTVWRMSLDVQRVLHYARPDGVLNNRPVRRVLTITDAIIAGEGDGPLAPTPLPLGFIVFGTNTAALDWVHALLMGFDPLKIPLVRHAFDTFEFPLSDFAPPDIRVNVGGCDIEAGEFGWQYGQPFRAAAGWREHCELKPADRTASGVQYELG
jgi:uncharacterized protein (DUF362 family)